MFQHPLAALITKTGTIGFLKAHEQVFSTMQLPVHESTGDLFYLYLLQ